MELESGIDLWVRATRVYGYRVRVSKGGLRYKVGVFQDYADAVKAKNDFIREYELKGDIADAVPQYSKEWFNREHKKQVEKFRSLYSTPTKDKPVFITIQSGTEPYWILSSESMRMKQEHQNDSYENDANA